MRSFEDTTLRDIELFFAPITGLLQKSCHLCHGRGHNGFIRSHEGVATPLVCSCVWKNLKKSGYHSLREYIDAKKEEDTLAIN